MFLTVCIANVALSDDTLEEAELWADLSEEINEAPIYEDEKANERNWALSIGLGAGVAPDYEGSNDYEFGFGPNISASWRDTIFFKGKSLGANIIRDKNLKAGLILAKASGRDEDDNDKLEGLGDVDGGLEVGGFVSYKNKPWRLKAEARQEVDSGHEGALVELSVGTDLPLTKPLVFVELGSTWASDDYMESFFSIDSQQSADSGLKRYNADAGFKDVNISISAGYPITDRWRIGAMLEYKRLLGDAADSPIVDDKNQFVAGFSFSYHMGSKFLLEDLK
jgi:outer membrane scaffolding protein for murein synthesis (MipA/OmpV family)